MKLLTAALLLAGAAGAQDIASGTFTGASDHITTGTGSVTTIDGQAVLLLGDDFTFDGAPDPRVGYGNGGERPAALLAPLASDFGTQAYALPEDVDPVSITEIWIWCEAFDVPLGIANVE